MNKADITNAISRIISNSLHDVDIWNREHVCDCVASDIYDTLTAEGVGFHRVIKAPPYANIVLPDDYWDEFDGVK